MSQNIFDVAQYLSVTPDDIYKYMNTTKKFGKYRVAQIDLKYTKDEQFI